MAADTYWSEKNSDHNLAKHILRQMERNKCPCNNEIYAKVTDLFGMYSDAAVLARQQMLFAPRLRELNPFPVHAPECPTERATYTLRQMVPDLDAVYNRFPIIQAQSNDDLDVSKWERSDKSGAYFNHHDSVITVQTESQIEALRDYDPSKPIVIESTMAYIDGVEMPVHIMRSENQVELSKREKRNQKFDPDYMQPIANAEWFAEFYGRDLESGQLLASKKTKYYGKAGVATFLNEETGMKVAKGHEAELMYPNEDEVFEKVDFSATSYKLDGGTSVSERVRKGHLYNPKYADEVRRIGIVLTLYFRTLCLDTLHKLHDIKTIKRKHRSSSVLYCSN